MADAIGPLTHSLRPVARGGNTEVPPATRTAQEFEAVFLTQFVDQMMKTTGETAFGGKEHAEMWRSFMSEAVAKHLVEQGGLGLSGHVEKLISAYTQTQALSDGGAS